MASKGSHTTLGWYLDQIKSTPLLTAEQERQLSRRIREHSDPHAREQMIQANLRLVVKIAKQYTTAGMTLSDLVAEGNLGLMRAVEEFDPDAGVRFSTYAAWWVKQAIKRAMIQAGQPIRIPAYLVKMVSKWRKTSAAMEAQLGRPAHGDGDGPAAPHQPQEGRDHPPGPPGRHRPLADRLGRGLRYCRDGRRPLRAVPRPGPAGRQQLAHRQDPAEAAGASGAEDPGAALRAGRPPGPAADLQGDRPRSSG